jgi:Putative lactococcus lactis phage r1t holin
MGAGDSGGVIAAAGNLRQRSFWAATGARALRTACQTFLALAGTGAADLISGGTVDWIIASLSAAVLSVLTSIAAGIPEVPEGGEVGPPGG